MKKNILILAANPNNTDHLRLAEEVREIKERLNLSKNRDQYEVKSFFATRIRDLRSALLANPPHIIHYSGHGNRNGIYLEDMDGKFKLVKNNALAELLELFKKTLKCVVLNSCFSERQANLISKQVDFVIGMKKEIGDRAAIEFSIGFYDAIGAGKIFFDAFKFGRNAIALQSIREELTPVLIHRTSLPFKSKSKTAAKTKQIDGRLKKLNLKTKPNPQPKPCEPRLSPDSKHKQPYSKPKSFNHARFSFEIKKINWIHYFNEGKKFKIGNGSKATLKINTSLIDKIQAEIYWNGERYMIKNCSISNPTKINSSIIKNPRRLGNNNKIQMGEVEMLFREYKE